MPDNINKYLFPLGFVLILILGETHINYFLLVLVSLFGLFFRKNLDLKKVKNYWPILILWIVFFVGLILSSLFTTHIPLTLFTASKYVVGFIVFWLLLLVKKDVFSVDFFLLSLVLTNLTLIAISLMFYFQPSLGILLPTMNIVYASHGHSHLSGVLLLSIPISWWWAITSKGYQKINWNYIVPLLMSLILIVSFGRVAILVGFIQFLIIWFLVKKSAPRSFSLIAKMVSIVFMISIVFFTFLSLDNSFCPIQKFERQLCKKISTELRPMYWERAWQVFADNPLFGSGPGTYGINSKKYQLDFFNSSKYAHNEVLQSLAEMGVLGGGTFIILMIGLLISSFKSTSFTKKKSWREFVFLGVAAIYADILFDFNWNFIGIFILTLSLLAILIRDQRFNLKPVPSWAHRLFIWIYILSCTSTIILGGIYLTTEYFIRTDDSAKAFKFFPYFHWHWRIYEKDISSFSIEDKSHFFEIYKHDYHVYQSALSNIESNESEESQQLKEQLFESFPLSASKKDLVSYYVDKKEWDSVEMWINSVFQLWKKIDYPEDSGISYSQRIELSEQMLFLADHLYKQGEYDKAGRYYLQSRWTNGLILGKHKPVFIDHVEDENAQQQIAFFRHIGQIKDGNHLGQYLANYVDTYLGLATTMIEDGSVNDIEVISEEIMALQPWRVSFIWNEIAVPLIKPNESLSSYDDAVLKEKAFLIWKLLKDEPSFYQPFQVDLMESLAKNGSFLAAKEIAESIFSWDEETVFEKQRFTEELQLQADKLAKNKDYSSAMDALDLMKIINPDSYWTKVQPANLAILKEDYELAKDFYQDCNKNTSYVHDDCMGGLQLLEKGMPNNNRYWEVSQIIRGEAVWQDFVN